MYIWSQSSACRVMPNARQGLTDAAPLVLHSGRNMTVCGQLILRDVAAFTLNGVSVTGVGGAPLPEGVTARWNYVTCVIFNDGVPYPDILSHLGTLSVKAHTAQSIWITLQVSAEMMTGTQHITVTAHTDRGDFSAPWTLIVHSAILPEPGQASFGHEYFLCLTAGFGVNGQPSTPPVEPFYQYDCYSPAWWDLMAEYAKRLKELRVNSLQVNSLLLLRDGGSRRTGKDTWEFHFELLDRFVEHFMANGSFRYLAVASEIASVDGGFISSIDENGQHIRLTLPSEEADAFAAAFYGALYRHFEEKGWLPMVRMRLQDEPHTATFWKWAREKCRQYMPGVACGEPLDTHEVGRELAGACDQYIPRLEVYHEGADFYTARQKAGDTVWCYSCCYPENPWWLNKFIDQPHSFARLIKWACFSQDITGFLHWGFNYWGGEMYGLQPGARFKGDGFIVYPDPANNTVCMSLRGAATCEGIQEWELLHMLAATDPAAAHALSRRIARSFCDFTDDAALLDHTREQLLCLLDEK